MSAGGAAAPGEPFPEPGGTDAGSVDAGSVDGGPVDGGPVGRGQLVLVATPIGNLGDLSPRAARILGEADVVCCEDTRRTRELLGHLGLRGRRLVSVHQHNEQARCAEVVAWVAAGRTVAVVSDAGMPGVSDPGQRLVAAVASAGLEVTVVPGPSAALGALVVSGLPTDRFSFEGFLPRQGAERRRRLDALAADTRTVVIHEAPGRLGATLADLVAACGPSRPVAVVRELTKLHEEVWRGDAAAAAASFAQRPVRGEVVVVVGGAPPASAPGDDAVAADVERRLRSGATLRDAAAATAAELRVSRRRAYQLGLARRRNAAP